MENLKSYFEILNSQLNLALETAREARRKGIDPVKEPEIPLVKDLSERVEGLISSVAPQVVGKGIPKRIKELEKKYGALDWRVSLMIALEVAKEKFCKFKSKLEAIETGIRVGFAYLTMGTVASPLEGFTNLKIRKTKDNKEYFALFFSGPIRSAGGTASAVCLLIADFLRRKFNYASYDPSEEEIKRMVTEVNDYHERVTNLQYHPSEKELVFLLKNLPIQIDGEPSEQIEVSNYKDLKRIETNFIRNGPCLVLCEGLAQKAPKILKQLKIWSKDFGLEEWLFLEGFVEIQKEIKAGKEKKETGKEEKLTPNFTFISDLVAGRPVLSFPLREGGLRLRYGRTRTSGYSSCSLNPLTMKVLDGFIAIGTQLKVERPGKATAITSCDSIEGPIIKTKEGSVIRIENKEQLKDIEIDKILFLGDILISYGDFYNRAHVLVPAGYCEEWWIQEFEKAIVNNFGSLDLEKASNLLEIPTSNLNSLMKNPLKTRITGRAAITISKKLDIPLHPYYTFYWSLIRPENILALLSWFKEMKIEKEREEIKKIILPLKQEKKEILDKIGLPHLVVNNEFVVIEKEYALTFLTTLGLIEKELEEITNIVEENKEKSALEIINLISEVKIRDKAGTFIGARMGRPEKAKIRKLVGSPQVLFPVGKEGGKLRSFQSALEKGTIKAEFPIFYCPKCNRETVFSVCEKCWSPTKKKFFCSVCGIIDKEICPKHGRALPYRTKEINIEEIFDFLLKKLRTKTLPDLIKGVRGTNNESHIPEHLIKGILRAKHNLYVNKDGTIRYDMTQLPITHFKPKEIGTCIEKLKEMGYEKDIYGKELNNEEQVLELKPQDIILPSCQESPNKGADEIFFNVANFIDELLEKLYDLKPFYNLKSKQDLIGHLVLALAPHTSSAILARIIGFSKTQGFFAHPFLHAATRRDCDGDEASVILLLDALINFSRLFLPSHRGSRQDAPLVLTSNINPSEVDDMVFDMDICSFYPLEFYSAALNYKDPREVEIKQIKHYLEKEEKIGFTHNSFDINNGIKCSSYKTIPSMEDKLKRQMALAEKIEAVSESDVARLVIEKHFLKDIKGNLRKFSIQQFRCVNCNEKYRRPPLIGKCLKCGGRIIFTISEGFVLKYLEPSLSLAKKYNVPDYLKHNLELVKRRVEDVFGKETEKQEGLGKWFG